MLHLQLLRLAEGQRMEIHVEPDPDAFNIKVRLLGSSRDILSKEEETTFNLTEEILKEAVYEYKEQNASGFHYHDPTKFGNLYSKHKWDSVTRTLLPTSYAVLAVDLTPTLLKTTEVTQGKEVQGTNFTVSILAPVKENLSVVWDNETGVFTARRATGYNIFMGNMAAGTGHIDLWMTNQYGKNSSKSTPAMLGNKTEEQVGIGMRETFVIELSATRVSIDLEILYEGSVTGDIFCNFDDRVEEHFFWGYSANYLFYKLDEPFTSVIPGKEIVTVEFFTDAQILVKNKATGDEVATIQLPNGRVPQKYKEPPPPPPPPDYTIYYVLGVLLILLLIAALTVFILKKTGHWEPFQEWLNK